ncbi:transcription antitermination factor NusB [Vagococcus salmoninarum]|uniref:Transcription antitermination protein NusB n=1 Tax=Vagococcus salmoninarum TaxID=2739 RepID=A0A429ZLH0_9ENTE|nr:transcription antitermination factor NusB [Vagococcus salmoninarum]MBE9388783.1 transcription antitermination factor NusB [Vagococcus salmoninarum]RST94541.1 N utilization substance protein B [Vagococcus salmoninarum]
MNSVELTRHEIREKALQSLYPFDFNEEITKEEAISYAFEYNNSDLVSEDGEAFVPGYLDTLVTGVCAHREELDELIKNNLKKFTLARIAKPDLIILRMAIFEIKYVPEVPAKVALNEALELTKKYSDDESRKFVNGVLSNIIKQLSSAE